MESGIHKVGKEETSTPAAEILPMQIERIDNRLKQIEKVAETVESVAQNGLTTVSKYFESRAERERHETEKRDAQHQREIELQDKLHKRSVAVLSLIVSLVFTLVITAIIVKQYELAKLILGSSLAVASGAGIASLFGGRKK